MGRDPPERPRGARRGINMTVYKLWAFALASFITGVAGALVAAAPTCTQLTFATTQSIILFAVALMGGVYRMWGAVVAAFLLKFLPAAAQQLGVSDDWPTILFGVGVLQVLTTAPRGIVDQMPKDIARLARLLVGLFRRPAQRGRREPDRGHGPDGPLRRRRSARRDERDLRGGTCGLIGPNGAGKTTFFNVLSGFVKPVRGSVTAFGDDLLEMTHFRRARWGVRRTFQTEQAIEELSVYDNVAMIQEHSSARRLRAHDVLGAIEFVGLDAIPRPRWNPRRGGAPARRGRAGGCRQAATGTARRAGGRPARRGDRAPRRRDPRDPRADGRARDPRRPRHEPRLRCCEKTAVLDFGKLIAAGPTAEVLRDDA